MKIYIDPSSILSGTSGWLRPVALTALKRLQDSGYELFTDTQSLEKTIVQLLENEEIRLHEGEADQADAAVQHYFNSDTEGVYSLQLENREGVLAVGEDWREFCENILFPARAARLERNTHETNIVASVLLDGKGESSIKTGIVFFDHMLDQIAKHGLINLDLKVDGDLDVDEHHTIEDTAIVLGTVIREALTANKAGIQRYGFVLPMDEAQSTVAIDLSDRPYLRWEVDLKREYVGDFPTEMLEHFFYTLAMNVRATIHVRADGKNEHHVIESIFKGFAKALRFAISRNERMKGILPSTKGII